MGARRRCEREKTELFQSETVREGRLTKKRKKTKERHYFKEKVVEKKRKNKECRKEREKISTEERRNLYDILIIKTILFLFSGIGYFDYTISDFNCGTFYMGGQDMLVVEGTPSSLLVSEKNSW